MLVASRDILLFSPGSTTTSAGFHQSLAFEKQGLRAVERTVKHRLATNPTIFRL
jgi:hypothetical protein